ncbi:adenosylcobinamide-phosphate synthase CbiB [Sphingobium sp.]|uniref:adenosylcobinamide-phosphate synthase CbiB n=1 Tax=Sphingobium sp. TaxID=1912891 RepID=UPI002D1D5F57|nr:adenosylcobinamide-phosphate synthase CbiB [Sphingobium sp.]HUD90419.1 adenosylcobinamide-phosphate synthase CbiB [Sphingobium sp.]
MADPVALMALALDAALGWPQSLYRRIGHPVGQFARIIERCERRWNRPELPIPTRRRWGTVTVLLLILLVGGSCWLLQSLLLKTFGQLGWIVLALLAWPALAQRSLFDHVRAVALTLEVGDLPAARTAVSAIVGRDAEALDESAVARAAIESLAESYCDGVTAPFFWLLFAGLPGVWVYKAINTADSLIGHKEERWRAFGWAAARTDDLFNLIPARLSGLLICLVAGGGWRILWRDARNHASPNAGWPEAAMSGALGVRLAGPVSYDQVVHSKAWIGSEGRQACAHDIRRALSIYCRACLMLWIIAAAAWLF